MRKDERRVVEGFRLPSTTPITPNERDWIDMLRCIVGDADPPPSLAAVQALRLTLVHVPEGVRHPRQSSPQSLAV